MMEISNIITLVLVDAMLFLSYRIISMSLKRQEMKEQGEWTQLYADQEVKKALEEYKKGKKHKTKVPT